MLLWCDFQATWAVRGFPEAGRSVLGLQGSGSGWQDRILFSVHSVLSRLFAIWVNSALESKRIALRPVSASVFTPGDGSWVSNMLVQKPTYQKSAPSITQYRYVTRYLNRHSTVYFGATSTPNLQNWNKNHTVFWPLRSNMVHVAKRSLHRIFWNWIYSNLLSF